MKKQARRGTGWPAAFEHPLDKKNPYKRYFAPNSGESPKLTLLGNQGLPGEPPDLSGSIGGSSNRDIAAPDHHPWTDFDPDSPFDSDPEFTGERKGKSDEVNSSKSDSSDMPIGINRRIFNLISENRDRKPNQIGGNISQKRSLYEI